MRSRKMKVLVLVLMGLGGAVFGMQQLAARAVASDRLVISCNIDGTYTCGGNCQIPPYNGRWCCEMPWNPGT